MVKTLYLIEELTALFIKFVPVIVSTIIFLAHDFYDELQPSKFECLLTHPDPTSIFLLIHRDHHPRSFLLFLHDPTCSKSSYCYNLATVLHIYIIAKSSVQKDECNICLYS